MAEEKKTSTAPAKPVTAVKKDEDLKEVDLLGDDNIFGGFATESTGIDNLFDTGDDDDENIFSALTESVPDMFDLFGDTVLAFDGDTPEPVGDYIEELKGIV